MADNELPDFLKGFDDLNDLDIDFGISAVSAEELGEKTVEGQKATEILESNVEGISNVEQKLDQVISSIGSLKALLDFDELNIEGKLDQILDSIGNPDDRQAEVDRQVTLHKEAVTDKLRDVEKLILPLLINLIKPEALEKKYIYWPNRKDVIERQIKKIMAITRSE